MSRIRRLREKAGLTQSEMARRLKVSEAIIRKWENGTRTPRLKRLKDIARVLRCQQAQLL